MKKIKVFQLDVFTDQLFSGNPAAVCMLEEWLGEDMMQAIAAENNLSETAFVVQNQNHFEIRWFTPTVEVDLCGHATLAAASIIWNIIGYKEQEISFQSLKSGLLKVSQQADVLWLDFPTDEYVRCDVFPEQIKGIDVEPVEVYKGRSDYMAVIKNEEDLRLLNPDLAILSKLDSRGLIVTAPGDSVDFVSRYFMPQCGINEDPATGSTHTTLIPFWSERLQKKELRAKQVSARGGLIFCLMNGQRVKIGGKTKLYLAGELYLD